MRLLLLLQQQVCTPGPKSQLVQMLKQQPGSLTPSFFGGCWCNNLHGCCKINLCACLQPRPQVFPDPHLVVLLRRMLLQQPRSTSPTPNLLCGCWSSNNLYYLHPPLSCATSAGDPEPDPPACFAAAVVCISPELGRSSELGETCTCKRAAMRRARVSVAGSLTLFRLASRAKPRRLLHSWATSRVPQLGV